jgi:hypothetical protein
MNPSIATDDRLHRIALLTAIAVTSVVAWQTELGSLALYPFTILATWFHEMGHGLAALLTGNRFNHLVIYADGSGYAVSTRPSDGWRLTDALIAAAGPMGPAIAGSLLIVSSRNAAATKSALRTLGLALIVSSAIWVRSLVGLAMLPGIGVAILALASYARPSVQRFGIQLLGVQACISTWQGFDYLFSAGGSVGGVQKRSDVSAIADSLLLPYWFWGAAISLAIVAMLALSLRSAFRK